MKYVYHVYCRLESVKRSITTGRNELSQGHSSFILIIDEKINNESSYEEARQLIWDYLEGDAKKSFTIDEMCIASLTFLHEVEE